MAAPLPKKAKSTARRRGGASAAAPKKAKVTARRRFVATSGVGTKFRGASPKTAARRRGAARAAGLTGEAARSAAMGATAGRVF